jgi:hypothetical protein
MNHLEGLELVLGIIIGAAAVAAIMWKVLLPRIEKLIQESLASNVEEHRIMLARLEELEDKKIKDYDRLKRHDRADRVIMGTLLASLKHLRTDNDTGRIDRMIDEMDAYLLSRVED